jgi:hypothetical protein
VPAFNYTGGDISHLTPGGAASMTDLQGPLTDVRTAINGNLDEINVPNLSAAFTTWKTIQWGSGTPTSGIVTVGGTYGLYPAAGSASAAWTTGLAPYSFYLNPADYLANARTTKLRLRAQCVVNGAAPGTNIVPGLYPVSSFGGASGASPTIAGVGTVITGSTVIFTTPDQRGHGGGLSRDRRGTASDEAGVTLPLELGGIRDPFIRRAFEQLAVQFPVVATGGGGGGAPTGVAGGDLGGTYPNPTVIKGQSGFTVGGVAVTLSTDPALTNSRTPSGAAGGALSGTYPSPGLANLIVVDANVSATAAIARSKLDFGSGLVNADISATAAIAKTKLANLDVVNADVNAAAAIAESKLNLATDASHPGHERDPDDDRRRGQRAGQRDC